MRFCVSLFVLILFQITIFGQNENIAFHSLALPFSARSAVLNQPIAIYDKDVEIGIINPSVLNPQNHGNLSLNFVDYFADIHFLSVAYAFPFRNFGTMAVCVKSIGYGEFIETDYTSQSYGKFGANEQIASVNLSKSLSNRWQMGSSVKTIISNLENYQSVALVGDLSILYTNFQKNLFVSLLARNYGRQLTTYANTKEGVPFHLDLGLSKQLEHLPFLFTLNYRQIQKWNLNPDLNITDEEQSELSTFSKSFFSHLDLGGELTLFKHIKLRAGFNPKRRQELKLNSYTGMVGFSWGIGVQFTHFSIDYGRSTYHLHGSPNYFSFSTDFSKFYFKNEKN